MPFYIWTERLVKLNLLAAKQRGIFDSGKEKVNALTPSQAAGNARPEFIE